MEWRWFTSRQVHEAKAFAAAGGIAVHENRFRVQGVPAAHMLGPDEATLVQAGQRLGLTPRHLHRGRTLHFDLFAERLMAARALCSNLASTDPESGE